MTLAEFEGSTAATRLLLRTAPGATSVVKRRLDELERVEVNEIAPDALSVSLTAHAAAHRQSTHQTIAQWPEVHAMVPMFGGGASPAATTARDNERPSPASTAPATHTHSMACPDFSLIPERFFALLGVRHP